jgi:hypothetical protein
VADEGVEMLGQEQRTGEGVAAGTVFVEGDVDGGFQKGSMINSQLSHCDPMFLTRIGATLSTGAGFRMVRQSLDCSRGESGRKNVSPGRSRGGSASGFGGARWGQRSVFSFREGMPRMSPGRGAYVEMCHLSYLLFVRR